MGLRVFGFEVTQKSIGIQKYIQHISRRDQERCTRLKPMMSGGKGDHFKRVKKSRMQREMHAKCMVV